MEWETVSSSLLSESLLIRMSDTVQDLKTRWKSGPTTNAMMEIVLGKTDDNEHIRSFDSAAMF
jgi:hypothetical protein